MDHVELLATILKRLAKSREDRLAGAKAGTMDGLQQLVNECGIPMLEGGWPMCGLCDIRPADLAVREDDEAYCQRCWDKLSAEEREGTAVDLLEILRHS